MGGSWQVIDERSFRKVNQAGVEYVLIFDDNFGIEATLASPVRNPPSKIRLASKEFDDLPPGFIVPYM